MKLLAIDGNSLINRAFYGIKLLTTKDGKFYTNGIYGFINMLNRLKETENPDGIAVAFDLRAPTFRHAMYSEYKAGRKGMPDELAAQMPLLKEWLTLMGYAVLSVEGFEADDILGTLAAAAEESSDECVIATGDRDSFQLVSDEVRVLHTVTKMGRPEIVTYDRAAIKEKYGVEPCGMIEIKALQGDASDNIPGVAGIGEKTAQGLISQYGSIDYIYEHIDEIDLKPAVRTKLISGKESAELSRKLGTIRRDVPISRNLNDYAAKPPKAGEVVALMTKLELFSLIERLGFKGVEAVKSEETSDRKEYITGSVELSGKLDIICDFQNNRAAVCRDNAVAVMPLCDVLPCLADETVIKRVYDKKSIYKYCAENGSELKSAEFDSMLAGYLCSPSSSDYTVERLAQEYGAAIPVTDSEDEFVKQCALHSEVCDVLEALIEKNGLKDLLSDIELPLAEVLGAMELDGVMIDAHGITEMGKRLAGELSELEKRIYEYSQGEFNINSPKQLGVVLFEKLMLPCKKKTKSGYSTGAEVLESLRDAHPIIGLILHYRKLAKLKSTYCDGLTVYTDSESRVHSTLNQTETRTGRISSADPNLQNIPVRTEEGRELRKYFLAKPGYTLIDADYSQIELRVLAHMANDRNMIDAFKSNTDIHTVTASQVFNMPQDMVTPLMRSRAKAVNFGIVYGIGAFSLAKDIGVTNKEAASYIKSYLDTYSGVADYMEKVVAQAKENGYVTTMFSRRRYLPELSSSNHMLRAFGERVARNMPIQGTAADIIKIAMIRVYKRLKSERLDARLILQIHDELIVEAKQEIADKVKDILQTEMENACKLSVPLIADTHVGKTWYDAKG